MAPTRTPTVNTPLAPRLTPSVASTGSHVTSTGTGFEPARIPVAAETTLRTVLPAPGPIDPRLPAAAPDAAVHAPAGPVIHGPHAPASPRGLLALPPMLTGQGIAPRGLQVLDFIPTPRSGSLARSQAPGGPSHGAATDPAAPMAPTAPSSPTGAGAGARAAQQASVPRFWRCSSR